MDYSQIPLKSMQIPEAIGWWPLAFGWWILIIITLFLASLLVFYIRKRLNDPRRFALIELKQLEQAYLQQDDSLALVVACNHLLKRLALTLYPRSMVAKLSGDAWISFLTKSSKKGKLATLSNSLKPLKIGPYQEGSLSREESVQLIAACKSWIKQVEGEANV